jgi:hypothetical protein
MVCSSLTFAHYTSLEKLASDKHYSLFGLLSMMKKKSLMTLTPEVKVMILLHLLLTKRPNKLEHLCMASLSRLIQHWFVKPGAYLREEHLKGSSHRLALASLTHIIPD